MPHKWKFNAGWGNAVVPRGNTPSTVTMLVQIYVAIWRHLATMI